MSKIIFIISYISFVKLFTTTFGSFCDSDSVIKKAFNLGTNLYLGQDSQVVWKYNLANRQTIDGQLNLHSIFGKKSFYWVDTAFTFVFDECDSGIKSDSYCEATKKANNLVIAIGKRRVVPYNTRSYGYIAFNLTDDHKLIPLTNDKQLVWNLTASDTLLGSFWIKEKFGFEPEFYYESSVFVKSRNELFVSVFNTISSVDNLLSKKLGDDGLWSSEWTQWAPFGFRGMFDINGRIFGFNKTNIVYEFKWSDDKIYFEPISNLREFFNCRVWNSTTVSPITENATTPTTSTFYEPLPSTTSSSSSTSSDDDITPNDDRINEINESSTINYRTTEPTPETTAIPLAVEGKSEPEQTKEEPKEWSATFIVAILVLIVVILIALVIIIRNKSKSRMVYLNSKSDDSKSAEIPLNNNDNNKTLQEKEV